MTTSPGPLTDSSPCGFGPSLYCIGGPLDNTRIKPLRRKSGRVHRSKGDA